MRRYKGCSAFFVLAFHPSRLSKERFEVLAVFGTKEKAEKIAADDFSRVIGQIAYLVGFVFLVLLIAYLVSGGAL